jgi:hypothetical protein
VDKHKQLQKINDLLDQCGDCPKRLIAGKPDKICGHCDLYKKIRAEGKKLDRERPAAHRPRTIIELTIPEYLGLHSNGESDEDIAFLKGVSPQQIASWKSNHGVKTKRIRQTVNLTVDEYKRMRKQGMTVRQIRNKIKSTQVVFDRWRKENGLVGDAEKNVATDEQVLQALKDHKSNWWIAKYLHCHYQRAERLAKEHGIAR